MTLLKKLLAYSFLWCSQIRLQPQGQKADTGKSDSSKGNQPVSSEWERGTRGTWAVSGGNVSTDYADPSTGAMTGSIRLRFNWVVLHLANFMAYELCSDELKNICWSFYFQCFLFFSILRTPLLTWSREVDVERNRKRHKRRTKSLDSPITAAL